MHLLSRVYTSATCCAGVNAALESMHTSDKAQKCNVFEPCYAKQDDVRSRWLLFILCQTILVSALAYKNLFNSFISVGDIPSSWWKAIITPIYMYKKGPSSDPANYRPVSLTNVFGKIMERVVAADMIGCLLWNSPLNQGRS